MTFPTFIPLNEASKRTGWTVERLRELVATRTIMTGKLPDEEGSIAAGVKGGFSLTRETNIISRCLDANGPYRPNHAPPWAVRPARSTATLAGRTEH